MEAWVRRRAAFHTIQMALLHRFTLKIAATDQWADRWDWQRRCHAILDVDTPLAYIHLEWVLVDGTRLYQLTRADRGRLQAFLQAWITGGPAHPHWPMVSRACKPHVLRFLHVVVCLLNRNDILSVLGV